MSWFGKKSLLRITVTAFTVFAVILCLFLTEESFLSAGSVALQTDELSGEEHLFFLDQTGKPVIFSVTNTSRFSFLRMDFLRSYALFDVNGAGDSVYALQFKSETKDSKDLFPLKLRI
jgi:Golgi nucleoside diphosphatase